MLFAPDLLQQRRILVTGASSGIGRASAQLFAACGARVIASGRDPERLAATVASLSGSGHQAAPHNLDGEDSVADWLKELAGEAPLDAIFHVAGIDLIRPIKMAKAKQFDDVFASSVKTALALARGASLRNVMHDGGALLFMSSVAAQRGQTGMSIYSAAKAAIDGLTRSLAVELAPRRIRVNAIAAAAIQTEMHARLAHGMPDAALQDYQARHLLGFGEAKDVAQTAAFLLSDGGRWVTGATWTVDGGYLAR